MDSFAVHSSVVHSSVTPPIQHSSSDREHPCKTFKISLRVVGAQIWMVFNCPQGMPCIQAGVLYISRTKNSRKAGDVQTFVMNPRAASMACPLCSVRLAPRGTSSVSSSSLVLPSLSTLHTSNIGTAIYIHSFLDQNTSRPHSRYNSFSLWDSAKVACRIEW